MNRKILTLLFVLLALCLCVNVVAQATHETYLDYGQAVSALSGGKAADADLLASRLLMRSKKPMANLESFDPVAVVAGPQNHYTLQFANADTALACMEALKADANVIYVQQDSLVKAYETESKSDTPKADPYLSWGAKAMGADDLAASITSSGSITVAVVDSGVAKHPFINDRVKMGGADFTNPAYTDGRHDVNGHGTHVSGTIVDLTQGLKVNILPVRVLGDNGSGANSAVCNGIRYAADSGAKVINMSLGGELFSPFEVSSEEADAISYAVGKGVTIVVAAGNSTMDTASFQPACFDEVIVVAAIDSDYKVASFSNFGDSVDVCAPGVNITSCSINGGYTDFNGTSMASPHVAAIAAMVKLQNPGFTPKRVENYIKAHCLDLGEDGWDRTFGSGMPYFKSNDAGAEDDYVYRVNEDGAVILRYTGSEAKVAIPATLGGQKVVAVEAEAFRANATIESLLVPGEVKEIGNFSFAECPLLKIIWFNEGVLRIGDSAFADCAALTTVHLPDSLENLGGEAFKGCAALTSLTLPTEIEAVGAYALSESGVTAFTVPASLRCVPKGMFSGCANLASVTVEQGVARIDPYAFENCTALKTISFPKSVAFVDYYVFSGTAIEAVEMPGVQTLGFGAFMYCDKLTSLTFHEGLESVNEYAFTYCPALTDVTFPRSLKEIATSAFYGSPDITVRGYTGSVAEEVTKETGNKFVSIGYQTPLTALYPASEETLAVAPGQVIYLPDLYGYEPEDVTLADLDWVSSDPSVCVIEPHLYYDDTYPAATALSEGVCTLTGTAKDGSDLSVSIEIAVGTAVVRNVRLSKNTLTLKVGGTEALKATVLPAAADQSVVWTSDNEAVATVDDHGTVNALSAGVATITAQSVESPAISDLCVVTVGSEAPVPGAFTYRVIDQSTAVLTGYTGTEKELTIPAEIDGYRISSIAEKAFNKSNLTAVTMEEGIEGIGALAFAGCAKLKSVSLPSTLTAIAQDAFKGCAALPKVKKLDLHISRSGNGFLLCPVFTPKNTASAYTVKLSGKASATVSNIGLVQPATDEYFTITVKAGGKKALLGVMDGEPYAASKLTIDGKAKRTLKMGKTLALTYTVKPESARVVATWASADPEIATVDATGVVTPVAPGVVTITLDSDIGLTDSVTVTVK